MTAPVAGRHEAIRGALVFLRPLEPDDAPTLHRWYADGEFRRLIGQAPAALAVRRARLERRASVPEDDQPALFQFMICRIDDGSPFGFTDVFRIDRVNGSAGFGIGIGNVENRGRGYGSDAVNALVDFCFGELRLERVWLVTDSGNEIGQRTYAGCGFVEEARLRRAFVDRGRHIDGVRMSLLRAEWEALPRKRSWDWRREAPAG